MIEGISAVTLGTHEMPRAVRFYRALGFEVLHGGEGSPFTSFRAGTSYLNLIAQPAERRWSWWGRVIFYVADVDALYDRALAAGYQPATAPRDAEWGERFFYSMTPTATNLVSLGLCSRFPSNSSCCGNAIRINAAGTRRRYCAARQA
jgi:catechol 2,3-dioxygenase-like lactoylglutathione lyase family enzyme